MHANYFTLEINNDIPPTTRCHCFVLSNTRLPGILLDVIPVILPAIQSTTGEWDSQIEWDNPNNF